MYYKLYVTGRQERLHALQGPSLFDPAAPPIQTAYPDQAYTGKRRRTRAGSRVATGPCRPGQRCAARSRPASEKRRLCVHAAASRRARARTHTHTHTRRRLDSRHSDGDGAGCRLRVIPGDSDSGGDHGDAWVPRSNPAFRQIQGVSRAISRPWHADYRSMTTSLDQASLQG